MQPEKIIFWAVDFIKNTLWQQNIISNNSSVLKLHQLINLRPIDNVNFLPLALIAKPSDFNISFVCPKVTPISCVTPKSERFIFQQYNDPKHFSESVTF